MRESLNIIRQVEKLVQRELSGWPLEWSGFNWPGYTYEHTLRVRNLSLCMARRLGADERIVELAALLHDIGKPAGEPHAVPGAERAEPILLELGIDAATRARVLHIIGNHITCDPAHPLENLLLYDADLIDANFGYIAFTRYITIRAHRGNAIADMATEGQGWLGRVDERRKRVITELGQAIARERYARMQSFHGQLCAELEAKAGPALDIARYFAADAHRPSLSRQVREMERAFEIGDPVNGLQPLAFMREFVRVLKEEIAGDR